MPPGILKFVKLLISIIEKTLNENYIVFYFSMCTVLDIFSFLSMDKDLVCVPPSYSGIPLSQLLTYFSAYPKNYSHNFPEILGISKQYKGNELD